MVARLGGDEFAVLATHIGGPEAATGLALRIIEELQPPVLGAYIGIFPVSNVYALLNPPYRFY